MKETVASSEKAEAGEFRLEDFLPYRLSVAADTITRIITRQHLSATGLGMSEWRLLAAVGRHTVLSPTAAGAHTSMDKVKVSRAAASLVARGLLKQSQDPHDGRGRLLRLTRKGNTAFATIAPTASRIEEALAGGLTKSEWTTLNRALGKLMAHARSVLGEHGEDSAEA